MPSPLASGGIGCSARGSRAAIATLSRHQRQQAAPTAHHSSKAITGSASGMGATSPRNSAARDGFAQTRLLADVDLGALLGTARREHAPALANRWWARRQKPLRCSAIRLRRRIGRARHQLALVPDLERDLGRVAVPASAPRCARRRRSRAPAAPTSSAPPPARGGRRRLVELALHLAPVNTDRGDPGPLGNQRQRQHAAASAAPSRRRGPRDGVTDAAPSGSAKASACGAGGARAPRRRCSPPPGPSRRCAAQAARASTRPSASISACSTSNSRADSAAGSPSSVTSRLAGSNTTPSARAAARACRGRGAPARAGARPARADPPARHIVVGAEIEAADAFAQRVARSAPAPATSALGARGGEHLHAVLHRQAEIEHGGIVARGTQLALGGGRRTSRR